MINGSKQMKAEAYRLPPVYSYPDGLPVYFLTGKQFLFQTLFCIRSLTQHTNEKFKFVLMDDGTFDAELNEIAAKLLPGAELVTLQQINQNLDAILPLNKYPIIRQKRKIYNHLKKLTDIHTYHPNSNKLVLDSDMLFWKEPLAVIDWLKKPKNIINIEDSTQSYGYSISLMEQLCASPITKKLNVGLIGFNSSIIDWDKIEHWIHALENEEGTSYFLEQALTAMIVSSEGNEKRLPKEEYIVNPSNQQTEKQEGTLHHYVDLSKKPYFISAWKSLKTK
ncbi:hypothetical protein [Pedobacter sp. GSP4]|uniref:hypothetical protein n=1 Tax=Pedobacter sp. GSP4 TaxID=3453716 RepID=UPI003F6E6A55